MTRVLKGEGFDSAQVLIPLGVCIVLDRRRRLVRRAQAAPGGGASERAARWRRPALAALALVPLRRRSACASCSTSTRRASRCSRSSSSASISMPTATTRRPGTWPPGRRAARAAGLCARARPGREVRRAVDRPRDHDGAGARHAAWAASWCARAIAACGRGLAGRRDPHLGADAARAFYAGFGFVAVGPPYLEDGIEHTEMLRDPRGAPETARKKYNRPSLERPHAFSQAVRRDRRRRRPRRHRGRARRCAHGRGDAAADAPHRDARADELQPVDRRHRQGPSGQGDRCARRRDGRGGRRGRHPVPHPERLEGAGGARDARPGGPGAVPRGDPAAPREPAEPLAVPGRLRRPDRRQATV